MILSLVLSEAKRPRRKIQPGRFATKCRIYARCHEAPRLTGRVRRLPNPRYSPYRRLRATSARWSRTGPPVPIEEIKSRGKHPTANVNKGSKGKKVMTIGAHEIRLPQPFSYTVQLVRRRTRYDEILGGGDTADAKQIRRCRRHSRQLNKTDGATRGKLGIWTHVSMLQMKGFGSGSMADGAGIPAMTGSIKYGPNLTSNPTEQ
jgi:hypothetical protein